MSIEYEIKDVIKIVMRKWYIIVGIAFICAVASRPICERSYQSVMNDYLSKKIMSNTGTQIDYEGYIYIGENDLEKADRLSGDIITIAQKTNELGLQFIYYKSISALRIVGDDVEKERCESYIKNLKVEIDRILLSKMDRKVDIRYEDSYNEREITAVEDILLKEPTRQESGIKVMGTSAIFGAILGLAVVLIFDYVKSCRKFCQRIEQDNIF